MSIQKEEIKLSYYTTHKDRFWQLSKTLKRNLFDHRDYVGKVEFVLVNLDNEEVNECHDWIILNFNKEMTNGLLKYYRTTEMNNWNVAIAKNTAAYYTSGKIIHNLDGDNFVNRHVTDYIIKTFDENENSILHIWDGTYTKGTYGNITCLKRNFKEIGGYDQDMLGMGHSDTNLLIRLEKYFDIHKKQIHLPLIQLFSIRNDQNIKLKHVNDFKNFHKNNKYNKEVAEYKLKINQLVANYGLYGIRENIKRILPNNDEIK